jgi:nucleoside triphosphate pyrophosphatase
MRRSVTAFAEGAQTRKSQLSPARFAPSIFDTTLLRVRVVTYVEKGSITFRMHRQNKPELILASSSPRRQELLREIGVPFQVHAANINEDQVAGESPIEYALRLAREKAEAIAARYLQSYVLGADTIVVIDGEVLGKPKDNEDAARMLRLLSARAHEVTTAVSLIAPNTQDPSTAASNTLLSSAPSPSSAASNAAAPSTLAANAPSCGTVASGTLAETRASTTKVYFREIHEAEIQQYVAGGEPMDKAGAYAIQGGASRWTDRIEGEFSNVVGLPLSLVTEMLKITGLMKS